MKWSIWKLIIQTHNVTIENSNRHRIEPIQIFIVLSIVHWQMHGGCVIKPFAWPVRKYLAAFIAIVRFIARILFKIEAITSTATKNVVLLPCALTTSIRTVPLRLTKPNTCSCCTLCGDIVNEFNPFSSILTELAAYFQGQCLIHFVIFYSISKVSKRQDLVNLTWLHFRLNERFPNHFQLTVIMR